MKITKMLAIVAAIAMGMATLAVPALVKSADAGIIAN